MLVGAALATVEAWGNRHLESPRESQRALKPWCQEYLWFPRYRMKKSLNLLSLCIQVFSILAFLIIDYYYLTENLWRLCEWYLLECLAHCLTNRKHYRVYIIIYYFQSIIIHYYAGPMPSTTSLTTSNMARCIKVRIAIWCHNLCLGGMFRLNKDIIICIYNNLMAFKSND